ncbi:glycosyl hydrolase [Ahniella affigens]|uniref:Glycosyl hydrolase n=1 Tax=Ahniella affigens TaxID=2021234 RepID=A0A2P1PMG9_9GAMM|nr:glycosyl hydrolase [Ahniella affigens]AVP96044.1 glycosyl hydrolase [Ahniella affigens]
MRHVVSASLFALALLSAGAIASAPPAEAEKPFGALSYRLIGPAVGGRLTGVAGVPGDPSTIYFTAAQGGVWKSTDGGRNFESIFDDQATQSIGSIAIAPSDPNVIYVGGGEGNPRGNVQIGLGIWRSTDAGSTWKQVWKTHGQIGEIAVDPNDPDTAYAAVLGSPFGPNEDRGVYRTEDGGETWERVLYKNADTGASMVAIDPNNPRILFAGLWQFRRMPWQAISGGPGSGLYRSDDRGTTWKQLTGSGLPDGDWGKVGVAVAPTNSARVYALIEAKEGGLFRSDDAGKTFKRVSDHHALRQRAWYYMNLTIDPTNDNVVWFPQVPLLRTIDGGKTVQQIDGPYHGDHHDVWIDPEDPSHVYSGNDGGIDVSHDGGGTWYSPPLPLAQFYNIDADDRQPYHVGGTVQDWGTASGPNTCWVNSGCNLADWRFVGGGEAGDFVFDRKQVGHIYAGEYGGFISHYVEGTGQYRTIATWPANPSGIKPKELKHRFQWTAPIADSPHHDGRIYHGAEVVFQSDDQGASWTAISPDLTRNDRERQDWSGGPITGDITGVETYDTVFSIAESPLRAGQIWAGTDDGLVHVTEDGGKNWRLVTPKGLPDWATIESIEPSRFDANTAYVVAHRYRLADQKPYVFRTTDLGKSWTLLTKGLPDDLPLWVVREDETDANMLYLGSDRGLWFSRNRGANWEALTLNLPVVAVVDLEARHGDLIIGTRGRALWVLDDVAALKALLARDASKQALLHVGAGLRIRSDDRWDFARAGEIEGKAYGASISYWLPEALKPDQTLQLEVIDGKGQVVRTLSSVATAAKYPEDDADEPSSAPEPDLTTSKGFNQIHFDLRANGAKRLNAKLDAGNPERGPLLVPGTYRLRLLNGTTISEASLTVVADPRTEISAVDMQASFDFARKTIALLDRANTLVNTFSGVATQLKDLRQRLGTRSDLVNVLAELEAAEKKAGELERAVHNPDAEVVYDVLAGREGGAKLYSQLSPLYDWSQSSDHAPTEGMLGRQKELEAELGAREADLQQLLDEHLAPIESALKAANVPHIVH